MGNSDELNVLGLMNGAITLKAMLKPFFLTFGDFHALNAIKAGETAPTANSRSRGKDVVLSLLWLSDKCGVFPVQVERSLKKLIVGGYALKVDTYPQTYEITQAGRELVAALQEQLNDLS